MTCPACGAPVPEGARFCSECGQRLIVAADERRLVTVLMADLVGFTALSAASDPEHVKRLVDACFEGLVADIVTFGGHLDKIVGDEIVALFGAPVAHEDDAERAVRAALRMQGTLAALAPDLGIRVQMRVGVNTGEVLVGAMRAGGDATVMGDVVNTAQRLQTLESDVKGLRSATAEMQALGHRDDPGLRCHHIRQLIRHRARVLVRVFHEPGRAEGINVFNRHAPSAEIDEALRLLHGLKMVNFKIEPTDGPPSQRWFFTPEAAK